MKNQRDLFWVGLALMFGTPMILFAKGFGYLWIGLGTGFAFLGGLILILFGLMEKEEE